MATICDLNLGDKTPNIDYPCEWEYKVIVPTGYDINIPLKDVLKGKEYKVALSHTSKQGTYNSYTTKVLVHSQDERQAIFEALKTHSNVKYVL